MSDIIRQLGRYELLRRIAVGGMGEIFLAKLRGTGGFEKQVIIKTILPHLAEEQEFVTKFLDEGRIVVQLTHGNIVPVFDMDEEDGEYYIAMEYIPGRDLRDVIRRLSVDGQTMPINYVLHIIVEVCKGLGYAHRKADPDGNELNIVHRDVSPSNILLSHEGEVKVIDFGIARATNQMSQTVSGRIQGKFCYMSPEQAYGKSVDERSDIFSTGVVLFEMLTGIRPFHGDTDLETLDLVRRCEFDPPSVFNPQISEDIDEIVLKALSKNLDDRYESIDQMQADLLRHLYTTGNAPGPKAFIQFLSDLFPDGVERRELKFGTGSRSPEKISLDDALDMELDKLLGGSDSVDPLTATAASTQHPLAVSKHTATLASPIDLVSKSIKATETNENTPPKFDLASPHETNENTPPKFAVFETNENTPPKFDLASPHETNEHTPPKFIAFETNEHTPPPMLIKTDDTPTDQTSAQTPPAIDSPNITQIRGLKRTLGIAFVLLALAVGAGIIFANTWQSRRVGFLEVASTPPGANIYVDGALIQKQTPSTLDLVVGTHEILLKKQGFASSPSLKFRIKKDKRLILTPIVLNPIKPTQKPRRFRLRSTPKGATVRWSRPKQAPQKAVTPMIIELAQGQFANVTVSHQNCRPKAIPITFDDKNKDLNITLDCSKTTPLVKKEPVELKPPKITDTNTVKKPKKQRFVITANPPQTQIQLISQGQTKQGTSSVVWNLLPRAMLTIIATKTHYKTYKKSVRVSDLPKQGLKINMESLPMGCLTFRAGYPQVNEYVLDGKVLGERTGLKNHPVSVGRHELIIRNKTIKKTERYTFSISAGATCYQKYVWPIPE